jgi:hypothetical protein
MNVTVVFRKPSVSFALAESAYEAENLAYRRSDIVIGALPLLPLYLSSWFQPTIPYEYTAVRWFVPCPQHVAKMEKVMNTNYPYG